MAASTQDPVDGYPKKDFRFWMAMLCIMIISFLITLDLTGIITALPTIVQDLNGEQFEWIGSAFALSATAFLPFTGALAQVFGRRFAMLLQLFTFTLGSALCGAAQNMNWLIAARVVQGIGAGGFASMSQIIISDLVPLHERGIFNAFVALSYCLSSGISPPIGGLLAQVGAWRWFFFMNIPFCAVAAVITIFFINFESPRGTVRDKIFGLDWIGNILVIGSSTAVIIALTWGGIQFSWGSVQVLVPLIVGFVGLVAFILYDKLVPSQPLVPFKVVSSLEAISGYLQGFFGNFFMLSFFYFIPIYFQACRGTSPVRSGVLLLPSGFLTMPSGIVAGLTIAKSGKYRKQLWLAWGFLILSAGLYSTMTADTSNAKAVGFQVFSAFGLGIVLACAVFPILAPISPELNPQALSFFMFIRFFAQSFGVAVGGTVLQNQLKDRLPAEFVNQFPKGTAIAYSIVPLIPTLDEPFRTQVRVAFADALKILWYVLIGIGGLGMLSSLVMRGISLKNEAQVKAANGHERAESQAEMMEMPSHDASMVDPESPKDLK